MYTFAVLYSLGVILTLSNVRIYKSSPNSIAGILGYSEALKSQQIYNLQHLFKKEKYYVQLNLETRRKKCPYV